MPGRTTARSAGWRNWAGNQRCTPAVLARPRDVAEVAAAVKEAAPAGRTVRMAGSGHSFTRRRRSPTGCCWA